MVRYLKEKTDLVEVFSVQLMEKKDKLENLQSFIHRFLSFNHDTDIIKQEQTILKEIEDTLAIRLAYCEWQSPVLLDSRGNLILFQFLFSVDYKQ